MVKINLKKITVSAILDCPGRIEHETEIHFSKEIVIIS